MKIEVDLSDVFGEEGETIADSIRRQVIDGITSQVRGGLDDQIKRRIGDILEAELRPAVQAQLGPFIEQLFDTPYRPVDRYGSRDEPTTFRAELLKTIHKELAYKPAQGSYDRNLYTKTVDDVVAGAMKEFAAAWKRDVDDKFIRDALAHAVGNLSERLGLTPKKGG